MNTTIKRIIAVTNEIKQDGSSAGCTSEIIAAAFILNDMSKLPGYYIDITDAWERLGRGWQDYVYQIKQDYRHLIV